MRNFGEVSKASICTAQVQFGFPGVVSIGSLLLLVFICYVRGFNISVSHLFMALQCSFVFVDVL